MDSSPSWCDSFSRRRMRPSRSGTVGRSVSSSYNRSVSAPAVLGPASPPRCFRSFTSFVRRLCMGDVFSAALHVVVGVFRAVREILGLRAQDPVPTRLLGAVERGVGGGDEVRAGAAVVGERGNSAAE